MRILIVDDVDDAAQALAMLLRLEGYDVTTARSGEQAIGLIEERVPHAVMLDINMPGIDGYELAKFLRQRHGDDIVLIAITGGDPRQARVADTFAVVDHYFRKPVDANSLRKVLGSTGAGGPEGLA